MADILKAPIIRYSDGTLHDAPELALAYAISKIKSLGYVQVVLDAAVHIPVIPDGATLALVRVEGQSIRYRDDGVDPTASVGMPLDPGEALSYDAEMAMIRVIAQADGAILNITFYGSDNG